MTYKRMCVGVICICMFLHIFIFVPYPLHRATHLTWHIHVCAWVWLWGWPASDSHEVPFQILLCWRHRRWQGTSHPYSAAQAHTWCVTRGQIVRGRENHIRGSDYVYPYHKSNLYEGSDYVYVFRIEIGKAYICINPYQKSDHVYLFHSEEVTATICITRPIHIGMISLEKINIHVYVHYAEGFFYTYIHA